MRHLAGSCRHVFYIRRRTLPHAWNLQPMILPNPSRPYRAWRLPRTAGLPLLALALVGLLSACGKDAPKPGATTPEVTILTLRSQPLALQQELPGRSVASQ
ncbi:MAG TPA: efflux transporter periplasmic adaptor subunit, partial [Stenotrophomonas sp.]|nr:efflux transporter periplasmic adaptor subunit [Stenotrophomonas sp.]